MILRRFMKHITDQNWFAVGLDVLVVITGIFLGMQVTEWNQDRKDRLEEQKYLERLFVDMDGAISDFYSNLDWDRDRLISQQLILDSLRSGVLREEDRETFETGLAYVGIHNPIRRRWGTVDELKSTGKLSLITDIGLRDMIAAVEAQYERNLYIITYSTNQSIQLRPLLTRHYDILKFEYGSNIQLSSDNLVLFVIGYARSVVALRDSLADILGKDKSGLIGVNFNIDDFYPRPLADGKRPLPDVIEDMNNQN